MAVSTYALVSLAEAKAAIPVVGSGNESAIEDLIDGVSVVIERTVGRHFVTRGSLTEYHTMRASTCDLYPRHYPIISVTTIHEDADWPRTYPASSALDVGDDYELAHSDDSGEWWIRRLSTGGPFPWALGSKAIKLVYAAGYATTAVVPDDIKRVALSAIARGYERIRSTSGGVDSRSDGVGTVTFSPSELLSPKELAALGNHTRFRLSTAEAA